MTAAKRRRGGTLARLEVLEAKEAARLEAVRAEKWAAITGAEARLSREDRAAIEDAGGLTGEDLDPDTLARMVEASEGLPEVPPIEDPAKEEALAWAEACLDVADGAPFLRPPAGKVEDFARFFDACALWCEEAARSSSSPEVSRLARWGAAFWRLDGALCRVLGGRA